MVVDAEPLDSLAGHFEHVLHHKVHLISVDNFGALVMCCR